MSNTIYSDRIKVNCPLVHDKNGYYHLIYRVTNKKNGKIYIGKHSTKDPYDSYMGSGIRIGMAIAKYGIENFTKEILFCFTNEKDAYLTEEKIVTQDFVDRGDTYNVITGGYGFSSEDVRGENNPMYGKKRKQETKDKISKANSGENNPMYGKHHKQETKYKISKARKGKQPSAKPILKIDVLNNIITEYGCMKDCCIQEHICGKTLRKYIKEHISHNGFYFEYRSKN